MELVIAGLITVVAIIVIGQHGWAGKAHFASEKMPPGALLISVVVVVTGLLFLYLTWGMSQPLAAQVAGLAVQLFSWWLFWQAIRASRSARLRLAFDENNPHGLVTAGPYRYVRHPFYVSYLLFWTGWSIAIWHPTVLAPLAIIIAIYVFAARMEERKFAATQLSGEYAAYRARVGFLWPKLSSLSVRGAP